jgi:predicted lactoylglutathione lyase
MAKMLFVNLPVADLAAAEAFYSAIGATKNPQFSDATSACMVFSESIHAMLLTHEKWKVFTQKPIVDAHRQSEVMLALSADDRAQVDAMTQAAAAHGGRADVNPKQDHGFMYGRSFEDPDGHVWEVVFVDMSQMPASH